MGVQSPFDAIAVQTVLAMHNVRLNDRFLGKTSLAKDLKMLFRGGGGLKIS